MKRLLITGGAGFIGSNFTKYILSRHKDYLVTVLDTLTYCGNLDNFTPEVWENPRFSFWKGDIRDKETVENAMRQADMVVHLAAETHVDRSIDNSDPFLSTDIKGTQVLLESLRSHSVERFIHISTSEVYGTAEEIPMTENHPLKPRSPYAAAKAGADRLAYAYFITYDLPIILLRPFNNYGPNQYPEKMIPLFITNALEDKPLPVYGDGTFTRDWLFVEDTCRALDKVLQGDLEGLKGEAINLGTGVNADINTIVKLILEKLNKPETLVRFVEDRPGHVQKHLSSTSKAKVLLDWSPTVSFEKGLERTIDWYISEESWWKKLKKKGGQYVVKG
ncbi:dTDP-glucose 4,6-dehydratase [candidate division NPL-UPA2 bacterium]|nr:dTDP-glucose 4,6-dehydratase [candidate division NPL-UPA2 bacterium]